MDRFLREIKIAANLNHPHILPLHDSGEADGFLFNVMPYVEGESLRDRLSRDKQLPIEDALKIGSEIADALGSVHRSGVVHRDIKPENVLLREGHAVVADFGIARAVTVAGENRLTETGTAIGTPSYLSPEQASGEVDVDGRSDVYSLGYLLYEMLAGQAPFLGTTVESILRQHVIVTPPAVSALRPTLSQQVVNIVDKALARALADRYQTAAAMAAALTAELTTPGGGITPAGTVPVDGMAKRRWMMVGGAVAVAAVIAVVAVVAPRGILTDAGSGVGVEGEAASRRMVVVPLENRTRDPEAADWGLMAAEELYSVHPSIFGIHAANTALYANRLDDALERALAQDVNSRCFRR